MKAFCIKIKGEKYFFDYEEGKELDLLITILEKAKIKETPFTIDDVIQIVKLMPDFFAQTEQDNDE